MRFPVTYFGGQNSDDDSDKLIGYSHVMTDTGSWVQRPRMGLELPATKNVDFYPQGIGKRRGSLLYDDMSGVMVASETIIAGTEFEKPDGTKATILLGRKAIYVDENSTGAFVQITQDADAYAHAATCTRGTFAKVDGHLFIGFNGANYIQVYRTGTELDDQLHAETPTTTVNGTSPVTGAVLYVTSTTSPAFAVNDRVLINSGGAREESGYIISIQAGTSITLDDNLLNEHTAAQADVVQIQNIYTDAYGSGTNTITGTWTNGAYLVAGLHQRLVYSDGTILLEATPPANTSSSGLWDVAGAGYKFRRLRTNVKAITTFSAKGVEIGGEYLCVFTQNGTCILEGFEDFLQPHYRENGEEILNHACFAHAPNWLYYVTRHRNIYAVNLADEIDVGRRLKALDQTGPLDLIDISGSNLGAWGFYNRTKQQVLFGVTTSDDYTNDRILVVDVKLGEPVPGEPKESFERRVRLLNWQIDVPGTNAWYRHTFSVGESPKAVTAAGLVYTMESGYYDMDDIIISDSFRMPILDGGVPVAAKQWLSLDARFIPNGNWNVDVNLYFGRRTNPEVTASFLQNNGGAVYGSATYGSSSYADTGIVKGGVQINRYNDVCQPEFTNTAGGQDWVLTSVELSYAIGASHRV